MKKMGARRKAIILLIASFFLVFILVERRIFADHMSCEQMPGGCNHYSMGCIGDYIDVNAPWCFFKCGAFGGEEVTVLCGWQML